MIDRTIRKKVERAFYNYNALKLVHDDLLMDTASIGLTSNYDKLPGVVNCGNSKENQFIRYLSKTEAGKWADVVDKTLEKFKDTGKDTLIKMKYFKFDSEVKICGKLYINRYACYDWLNDIITYAAFIALQFDLLKVV